LRKINIKASSEPVLAQTLEKYSGLILKIQRTFEVIRTGNRRLKRQSGGDEIEIEIEIEIDIDAIVQAQKPVPATRFPNNC